MVVWGTFDPQKLLDKGDNYFSKLCNDLKVEKAHMKFCKFSLGGRKRSSNLAVIGELGRYPFFIEIIISMFYYLTRLSKSKEVFFKTFFCLRLSLYQNYYLIRIRKVGIVLSDPY